MELQWASCLLRIVGVKYRVQDLEWHLITAIRKGLNHEERCPEIAFSAYNYISHSLNSLKGVIWGII